MIFNEYPYQNINDFNLDYLLKRITLITNEVENFVSINAIKYADPIQWNITTQYEKNTIVIDPVTGTAYISVAPVPAGVALTRPEFWTVVFDLGRFVIKASQNFTSRYESETTTTATFNSNVNDWLIWGDSLYRALVPITAGDRYVVNSNIRHFTIEDVIGHIEDLTTANKDNIVAAINELIAIIGSLTDLSTVDNSNIVAAINEVVAGLNALSDRMTTAENNITDISDFIGNSPLDTTAQKLTDAINEIFINISHYNTITTPEQYGAVGDGIADDTLAVQSAINAGNCCVMNKTYKTTAPISVSTDNFVVLNGTINYTGNDCAVIISSNCQIVGLGTITSAGTAVIANKNLPLRYAIIEGLLLSCEVPNSNIIHLESDAANHSVTNNRFVRLRTHDGGDALTPVSESGIFLHTTLDGYINENRFEQMHFAGSNFAIKMLLESNHHMNRNQFLQISTENCAHGLYAYSPANLYRILNNIFDFRTNEWDYRVEQIQIDPNFYDNLLYGSFLTSHFKSLNTTVNTTPYAEYSVHENRIIGAIRYAAATGYTINNPTFKARGNDVMFDLDTKLHSAYMVPDENGVVTLSYSGVSGTTAGSKIFRVTVTEITIDLDNKSNYYFSPIRFINVVNVAGCDLTIVDGANTLFAQTHLDQGIHEFTYTSPTAIVMLY